VSQLQPVNGRSRFTRDTQPEDTVQLTIHELANLVVQAVRTEMNRYRKTDRVLVWLAVVTMTMVVGLSIGMTIALLWGPGS
jgi:hypothetical protein